MDRDPVADARDLVAQRYPGSEWALLTGSVLTPARTAGSDLDVVVCLPDGSPGHRLSLRHRGWPVELFVNTVRGHRWFLEREVAVRKPTLCRMIATGMQVAGSDGAAAPLQAECAAVLAAGPGRAAADTLEADRYGVTDLLDDLEHTTDPGEAEAVRVLLWERTARLALAAAGWWDGGGKWLVRELRACDEGLAERWLAARHDDAALARVVREVLDGAGGPVFEGFRRESPTAG